jgi:hypothetical protein
MVPVTVLVIKGWDQKMGPATARQRIDSYMTPMRKSEVISLFRC